LPSNHTFIFEEPFQEKYFTMKDGKKLNGLLFSRSFTRTLSEGFEGGASIVSNTAKDNSNSNSSKNIIENLQNTIQKSPNSKGLVVYFHGNAGTIAHWGKLSTEYLDLGYDFFVFDYRG
jgi:pimeloyl-ACP methyl ester carboxylesterase